MKIYDLALSFMFTDPKQRCQVYKYKSKKSESLYDGRIEFLYECNNILEKWTVINLEINSISDDYDESILIITAKE